MGYAKNSKSAFRKHALESGMEKLDLYFAPSQLYKDKAGIEWKDQGTELLLNNVFYEIISVQKKGQLMQVKVVEDKRENHLFSFFFKFQKKNRKTLNDLFKLMHSLNYEASEVLCTAPLYGSSTKPMLPDDADPTPSYSPSLLKPPCGVC